MRIWWRFVRGSARWGREGSECESRRSKEDKCKKKRGEIKCPFFKDRPGYIRTIHNRIFSVV